MYCSCCGKEIMNGSKLCSSCMERNKTNVPFKTSLKDVILRQNRINFFTALAYNILISDKKYRNIFIIICSMVVGVAMLVSLCPEVIPSILSAIDTTWNQDYNNIVSPEQAEREWRNVWFILIFSAASLCTLIVGFAVFIKMIKIKVVFKKRGIKI